MEKQRMEEIGRRIKLRRDSLGLTQDALAEAMGIPSRQTLGQIENGKRRIKPAELVAAAASLDVEVEFFTDPFVATGEAAFSFRADRAIGEDVLADFKNRAERWLVAYRELAKPSYNIPSLTLRKTSSYEAAQRAAEGIRRDLQLGEAPAKRLPDALTEKGILVLYVEPEHGVSGAASSMEGLHAVLLNRHDSAGRRNFDLAHELFHVLTWGTMAPEYIDSESEKRLEELADNFASALLMPEDVVRAHWSGPAENLPALDRIRSLAHHFEVSGSAMKWRLFNLGLLKKSEIPSNDADLSVPEDTPIPPLFSLEFVRQFHTAVESGRISLRKASSILGLSVVGFGELCRIYGRSLSYEV
jgi:Zn-dependent peptidase ImmA (M78 family)/DNA-binding XRE family transcriptional regulator